MPGRLPSRPVASTRASEQILQPSIVPVAAEITGQTEGQLRKFRSIAGTLPLLLRRNNLGWSHHREAASIKTNIHGQLASHG
jgi:hypothetical protein